MQINTEDKEKLKDKLQHGKTLEDFTDLINYIIEIQNRKEGANYKLISQKQMRYYYSNLKNKYVNFDIPKKTGGKRTITAPDKFLKQIQRRINLILTLFFEPKPAAHGFLNGRSIVTNAAKHVRKKYVLNVDLKDFFPSIHFGRVKAVLKLPILKINQDKIYYYNLGINPYVQVLKDLKERYEDWEIREIFDVGEDTKLDLSDNRSFIEISFINGDVKVLNKSYNISERAGMDYAENIRQKNVEFYYVHKNCREHGSKVYIRDLHPPFGLKTEFAHIISNFCCFDGKLPQGAPTSPLLTNMVSQRLDYKLVKLAKENFCFYTRYADDITFSSDKISFNKAFLKKLNDVVVSEGFEINQKKSRIQKNISHQEVTGITVNNRLNLPRSYVRKVRAILNNWEKLGYEKANAKFALLYPKEKGFLRNSKIPPIDSVVRGKILFLGMVKSKDDDIFCKYNNQLKALVDLKNK